ncbi:hypothetical protein OG596_35285 [Streptomyces sp. NBC_01102]|uniref:hypothetical protein n=1 Tax=Streptomyces sp. NBC_01102 TaxID=2903749 RepID=UPI00386D7E41|nr:hypothetical protein OG596_35285 [Streptomyces sp. NBC_01102]
MRSLRLVLAGLVLTGTVFVLTALMVPQAQNAATTAVAVFCTVWLVVVLGNALGGITQGHPPRLEAGLAVLVLAVPTSVALALWSVDGLEINSARTPWVLAAGVALWAVILQLATVWNSEATFLRTQNATIAVFLPLWLVLMLVNVLLGMNLGYTLAEELPVLALNFGVPAAVAAIVRAYTRSRRTGRNTAHIE